MPVIRTTRESVGVRSDVEVGVSVSVSSPERIIGRGNVTIRPGARLIVRLPVGGVAVVVPEGEVELRVEVDGEKVVRASPSDPLVVFRLEEVPWWASREWWEKYGIWLAIGVVLVFAGIAMLLAGGG